MRILDEVGLAFDDVLLVPRRSDISSRFGDEIDMSVEFLPGLKIKYPIVSANMDRVSDGTFVSKLVELGGIGIVHRFLNFEDHVKELKKIPEGFRIGCIGVGPSGLDRLKFLVNQAVNLSGVLIDVAHGHSASVIRQIREIKGQHPELPIIAGNVATYDGTLDLLQAGADSIKVGVGCGSLCSTRVHTGNGVPQLTAVIDCKQAIVDFTRGGPSKTLVADGGVRFGGDCCKALAAGADAVMMGSVFAGTYESPGKIIRTNGGLFKNYRGSASLSAQEEWKGVPTSVEGESTLVPYKGSLEEVFTDFMAGVKSGFSYQNAHSISDIRAHAVFRRQTQAGYIESTPHGVRR